MPPIFETERLIVRPYEPDRDAEAAFDMYGNPEVMRYLGRAPVVIESVALQRERLRSINETIKERSDGGGYWAIEDKATGEVVGTVILKRLPGADEVLTDDWEVGWHLRPKHWGNGYATEAAQGAIQYGFAQLKLPMINAIANKENTASLRVMDRLGMTHLGTTDKYYGVTAEHYQLRP